MSLTIYLHFNGNCREVFDYYRSIFGGDFMVMQTFRDGPDDMGVSEDVMDQVMHVSYPIGSSILMGSDVPPPFAPPRTLGDNFSISYSLSSREKADEVFTKLSDGGQVTMPLDEMFWGSYFGSCIDKFGIGWQVDVETSET